MPVRRGECRLNYEWRAWSTGWLNVAGLDEAGRGPLAGPVVAAAVIFPPGRTVPGVDDSKRLSPTDRTELSLQIMDTALAIGIGVASVPMIDRDNILQAARTAFRRAVSGLRIRPDVALIDGYPVPDLGVRQYAIIGGDASSDTIAAASIIAKVWRDRLMDRLDLIFPGYGFCRNRGYCTREHREALARHGPCAVHRRSFSPVRESIDKEAVP